MSKEKRFEKVVEYSGFSEDQFTKYLGFGFTLTSFTIVLSAKTNPRLVLILFWILFGLLLLIRAVEFRKVYWKENKGTGRCLKNG